MAWTALAAPALVAVGSLAVSVVMVLPMAVPDRPAVLLILPGLQQHVLAVATRLDPDMRLLGVGAWSLTIAYHRADLPAQLSGTGVLAVTGSGPIGCHV